MKKVYVVVYVSVSVMSGDIYTEQKVTVDKSVAQTYFNDYLTDISETTGNEDILESINDSIFDCDGGYFGSNMYHIEISEVVVND